jgi:hypothetical protein
MAIIYSYPKNINILGTDVLIGTSTIIQNGKRKNQTKSFTMLDISNYVLGNFTPDIPTLQQVTTAGATTDVGITINPEVNISALTINTTGYGVGVVVNSTDSSAISTYSTSGNSIVGDSETGSGVQAFSNFGNALFTTSNYGVPLRVSAGIDNTSNLAEFKLNNSVNQAYITHNGTIVSNKSLINTTVDNGVDTLQVEGSGFFQNAVTINEGLLKLNNDFSGIYTSLYSGDVGFVVTRDNGNYFGIDDIDGFVTNTSATATSFIKEGGTSSQFLKADGSVDTTTYLSSIPTWQQVTTVGATSTNPIVVSPLAGTTAITGNSILGGTGLRGNTAYGYGVFGYGSDNGAWGVRGWADGAASYGVRGQSINGVGTAGFSDNNIGIFGYSTSGKAGIFNIPTSSTSNIIEFQKNAVNQAYITHDGIAVSNKLLVNRTVDNGTDRLQVTGNGLFTGTLEVDAVNNGVGDFLTRTAGGIITRRTASEVRSDIGAQASLTNPITGTGANGQVAFWNGTNTQAGSNNLFWDATNNRLRINQATDAGFRLDVNGTARVQGTTESDSPPLGSELLTVSNWTTTGWTGNFTTGFTHTTGNTSVLSNTLPAVIGTYYKIQITMTGRTAGSITVDFGGQSRVISATRSSEPLATTTGILTITPTSDFDGTILVSARTIGLASPTLTINPSVGTGAITMRATNVQSNTIIGLQAGQRLSSSGIGNDGGTNTFIGFNSGRNSTISRSCTFIGNNAGQNNVTGESNTYVGSDAGVASTTGIFNTAIGTSALQNTTGASNTAIGTQALINNTTGNSNTAIGSQAGRTIADGTTANIISTESIYIGIGTRALANNQNNQIVIGTNAIGLGSNTTVLGSSSTTDTAIYGRLLSGTTTPIASAQVQIDSTTRGFLPPRMTTAQINAISSPAVGLVVYNTTLDVLCYRDSVGWKKLTSTIM